MTQFCYQLVERRVKKGYKTFIEEKRLAPVLRNSLKMLVERTEILKNIDSVFLSSISVIFVDFYPSRKVKNGATNSDIIAETHSGETQL